MSIFFYTALLKDIYRNFGTNKNKKFNKIYFLGGSCARI